MSPLYCWWYQSNQANQKINFFFFSADSAKHSSLCAEEINFTGKLADQSPTWPLSPCPSAVTQKEQRCACRRTEQIWGVVWQEITLSQSTAAAWQTLWHWSCSWWGTGRALKKQRSKKVVQLLSSFPCSWELCPAQAELWGSVLSLRLLPCSCCALQHPNKS